MRLYKIAIWAVVLIFSYFLGHSQCQIKNATQKLKEVQYVSKQEKEIMAQPHADKSDLLELMRHSKF